MISFPDSSHSVRKSNTLKLAFSDVCSKWFSLGATLLNKLTIHKYPLFYTFNSSVHPPPPGPTLFTSKHFSHLPAYWGVVCIKSTQPYFRVHFICLLTWTALPSVATHCDGKLWVGVDGPRLFCLSSGRLYDLALAWGRAKGRCSRNNYWISQWTVPMASVFLPDNWRLRVKIHVWGFWFLETASWDLGANTLPCHLLWVWLLDLRTREEDWGQALITCSLHRASERMQNKSSSPVWLYWRLRLQAVGRHLLQFWFPKFRGDLDIRLS